MPQFVADDGNCPVQITAPTAEEAAQEYVEGGDWGETLQTTWITVYVYDVKDPYCISTHKIQIDPVEPRCTGEGHNWESPFEIVNGDRSNPGVFGSGGGVRIHEVCLT